MIDNTEQEVKDKFLDNASKGDLETIRKMIHDGDVNILCNNDFECPYYNGCSRGKNASYFALLNGHINVAEYLIKITSGVILNLNVKNDEFIKKIAIKGDLKTLDWLQNNIFNNSYEKTVGMVSIIYLFNIGEHKLLEEISLHFDLNANIITDNLIEERRERNKELDGDKFVRNTRDIEIDKLTKPIYKVNS